MSLIRLSILSLIIFTSYTSEAQGVYEQEPIENSFENSSQRNITIGDTIIIVLGNCKNNSLYLFSTIKPYAIEKLPQPLITQVKKSISLIKVHGNVLYNFSYRSYIDTPFAQQDVIQHLVQTNFNFVVKDKYPVKVTLTNRSSNSPYFANATDVSFQFNQRQLLDNIKAGLKTKVNTLVDINRLQNIEQVYKDKQYKAQQLQAWINSPARVQELVEEKEKKIRAMVPQAPNGVPDLSQKPFSKTKESGSDFLQLDNKLGNTKQQFFANIKAKKEKVEDSLKTKIKDTVQFVLAAQQNKIDSSSVSEKIEKKKQELANLKAELKKDEAKVKLAKKNVTDSINKLKSEINSLNSANGLHAFMQRNNIAKDELTKTQKVLLAVKQVGIGRSFVDYSELTVKNVSLSGINIEMNPGKIYLAAAAGKVNYRFRDFIVRDKNSNSPNQSLYLFRVGIGQKEKSNFILTFYNGKKSVLNGINITEPYALQRVLGISAETRLALNENNYLIAEVAKSSYNTSTTTIQNNSTDLMRKATNFKLRTNEAFSIKLYSNHPQTDTKITGYYKKTGENFQSFNLNPININQDAWMARVNQQFWKRRIILDASVRKNDFNSPIAAPSFSTQTVFKALQVSVRIPKYPFVSVGYYPSSQLSLSNNNVLLESQYNTFNAVMSYSYQFKKLAMNTNAMYTQFYNNSSDTGFIYFNATNYTISHSIFLSRLTLQTSAALTNQKDIDLFTAEEMLSYQFKKYITLGGAVKWNRVNNAETLIGGTASMSIQINKIGTIQFYYDKTFLPGYNRTLLPVDMGRMVFYREF